MTTDRKKLRGTHPDADATDGGMITPIRWVRNAEEQRALQVANGGDPARDRATVVVLIGAALLLLLALVRIALR